MSSQEDTTQSSPPPGPGATTAHLPASKFQRKAKFRRASVSQSQSDTEFIPGLSKSPSTVVVDASGTSGKETTGEPPLPALSTTAQTVQTSPDLDGVNAKGAVSGESLPFESIEVEASALENAMKEDQPTESESTSALHSPSLSPKVETKTLALSPDSSQPATSPPELTNQDDTPDPAASSTWDSEEDSSSPPDISPEPDIRPFSPEELSQAKSLVLDLLGWGVEPEFLVTSGVSAEALYRIFTDLNLRLPQNLEVSEDVKAVAYSWGPMPGAVCDADMDWDSDVKQPQPLPQPQVVD